MTPTAPFLARFAVGLAFTAAVGLASAAQADPLAVMSAGAVSEGLKELIADYTKVTGVEVTLVVGNVGMIQDRLKAGEKADVVILSAAALGDMEKAGGLAGKAVNLGSIGIGVAVKADAPKPDISTPESFKAALLAAKSIAYSDPAGGGSSGVTFDRLIQKLGIADEIRRKAVLIRGGSAADRVASGEAAMAVQNISELMHVDGVELVGPFPPAYRSDAVYAAGISATSARPQDAQIFLAGITAPAAAAVWKAAGVEPMAGK
jgi:molybdate transport system substrate-binding protein